MRVNKNITFERGLTEESNPGYRYAILTPNINTNGEFDITHPLARCKDYVQDIYWSEITKRDVNNQYGFYWKHDNNNKISQQEFVNLLLVPDVNFTLRDKQVNMVNMLNILEKELNIPLTISMNVSNNTEDIIITYSNEWSKKPYLISLYFLLLRCSLYFTGETLNDVFTYINDAIKNNKNNLYSSTINQLNAILKQNKLQTIFVDKVLPDNNYSDYTSQYQAHNQSGIVSVQFKILNIA